MVPEEGKAHLVLKKNPYHEGGRDSSLCGLPNWSDCMETAGPHPIRRRLVGYITNQSYTSEDSPLLLQGKESSHDSRDCCWS